MKLVPAFAAVLLLCVAWAAPQGRTSPWQVGGIDLGALDRWLSVRDLAAPGDAFVPVPMTLGPLPREQGHRFTGSAAGLKFAAALRRLPAKELDAWELHCTVTADPPADRAIIVRVSLPLDAVGWTWWDNTVDRRAITAPGTPGAAPGGRYAAQAPWDDPREGSTYPLAAVSGPDSGVTEAIPLSEPRVYRLAYDASRRALEAEFDLGLTPETAAFPASADFRLLIYPHDPKWGFRDAVERYYRIFPDYAVRRAGAGGTWVLGLEGGRMACPWDWGMRFDEGGETRAGYDAAHDILPFVYTEPWGRYRGFGDKPTPDKKPRYMADAPLLPPAELKQSVLKDLEPTRPGENEKASAERREWAQAIVNSAIERRDGSWIWHHWTDEWSPGNWLSNVILNPDPKLPEPNRASVTWKYELLPAFDTAKASGGELAGIYLDSVASFIGFFYDNFRRDQWKYASIPMVADYEAKAPAQLHAFANVEFARQVWERMKARDKLVIANTFRPYMQWFCPLIDMIGAGEGSNFGIAGDDHYRYLRVYGYRKPVSWMDYGFVNPKVKWADEERGIQRCLFYAVHPGTGGFQNPADYEPSRPLFRYYEPLIIRLDEAGWQPVTWASSDNPDVLVERYGPSAGVTFVALRNAGKDKTSAMVDVWPNALPPGDLIAWRMVGDGPLAIRPARKPMGYTGKWQPRPMVEVSLAADATEVVAFGRREDVARLWLTEAQRWLARTAKEGSWIRDRAAGVLINPGFEEGVAGWGIDTTLGKGGEIAFDGRNPLSGKQSLHATSRADDAFQSISQGVSLASGPEYTVRFKYLWQRPEGAQGTFSARFGVQGPDGQWAADKYIYFGDIEPTGEQVRTYEAKFSLPEGYSAKFFQFLFNGNWGTAWADDVDVTWPAAQDARERMAVLPGRVAEAAARMQTGLATAKTVAEMLRLASAQRPTYEALTALADPLPDDLTRRRMTLPLSGFAEALGRAEEVLTGVPERLNGADGPLFGDVAAGTEAKIAVTVGEKTSAMSVKAPATALGGWIDVMTQTTFQGVWLPRRVTLRLHPPVEVSAAGPVSAVRQGVTLKVRSWAAEATVHLSGTLANGAEQKPLALAEVKAGGAGTAEVTLALPDEAKAWLDGLVGTVQTLRLGWSADDLKGETDVDLVRGATCPQGAAPVIDGKIGADEWAGAAKLERFMIASSGKPAARSTTVLVRHDDANLYLAFECGGQPNPAAKQRAHDGPVWEDDAVEVFLQPPGEEAYYHFAVNAAGSTYEARCTPGSLDAGWSCSWAARSGRSDGAWTVEMVIPVDALGSHTDLHPAGLWRANFGREEADTGAATCWSPTFGGFHTPARFGDLLLE